MNNEALIDNILDQYFDQQINREEAVEALRLADTEDPESTLDGYHASMVVIQRYAVVDAVTNVHRRYVMAQSLLPEAQVKTMAYDWKRPLRLSMRFAAAVLLIFASWIGYQVLAVNQDEMYQAFYQQYTVSTQRDASANTINDIVGLVRTKKYTEALQQYQQLLQASPRERFFGGYAAFESGNYPLAIQSFSEILRNNQSNDMKLYNDEAEFYLGLAYIKSGQASKAIPLFEKIHQEESHTYHDRISSWDLFRLKRLNGDDK